MGAQQIGFAPLPAVALILSRFDRVQLGSFVEVAIELMDVADGDFDAEPSGDELDGSGAAEEDTPQLNSMVQYFGNPEDAEEDDHSGGNAEDEGEPENGVVHPAYGIDQTTGL